jgi:NAD(P)-dependent dehydrogenase (short-subunit alcohol dehydrogenase family)
MASKVVLITGADGGLGTSVTRAFLDAGATVVGVSRKISASTFKHSQFVPLPAELNSVAAADSVVGETVKRFSRLDAVAHLVGGFAGGPPLHETSDADFRRMFAVNVDATFYVLRAAITAMRKLGGGSIVAVGSRAAEDPGPGVAAYAASKAALVSLVRTAARENKDANVSVNAVLPGTMDTPANRAAMPGADVSQWVKTETVAKLILWLVQTGIEVTGAAIPVYGRGL